MNTGLLTKAVIITVLMPGAVIVFIPYLILHRSSPAEWSGVSPVAVIAVVFGILGLYGLLHSIWGFAVHGGGTLAPIDPPKVLVIKGLYRYTRNPMYLAITVILLAEATYFRSSGLIIYAAAVFFGFHFFVVFYEEPRLRSWFGQAYHNYVMEVPRWWITLRGFKANDHAVGSQT